MNLSQWFNRFGDKIYATHVKETFPSAVRSHVFVMCASGIWQTGVESRPFKWLTFALFIVIGIIFPLSLFANVFFVSSIEEAMDHVFLSLSCWATAFKTAVIYWRRDSIRELFRIHAKLTRDTIRNAKSIDGVNFGIHAYFTFIYCLEWCTFVVQTSFSAPELALHPSTSRLPYNVADLRSIYWAVLVYQIWCHFVIVVVAAMEDTFYIALMNMACSHVDELEERLKTLGTEFVSGVDRDVQFYRDLIAYCERYENCLR